MVAMADDKRNEAKAQFNAEVKLLAEEMQKEGHNIIVAGSPRQEDDTIEAIRNHVPVVTISQEQTQYCNQFGRVIRRIGEDVDDDSTLQDLLVRVSKRQLVEPADVFGRNINASHSPLFITALRYLLALAQAKLRSKDWADAFSQLIALQLTLFKDDTWLQHPCECDAEEVDAFLKDLSKAWDRLFARDSAAWTPRSDNVAAIKLLIRLYNEGPLQEAAKVYDDQDVRLRMPVKGLDR